jgi:two-component system cell cycle sensor histidine kinase/response regulator CckA
MSDTKKKNIRKASFDKTNPAELHRILFDEAADGIFISDLNGRYVAVNQRGTDLCGYSRQELLGMTITDLIPPEDLTTNPIRMNELSPGKIMMNERRIRRKDGSLLFVEISARMLREGKLMGIVRDITERKRAEEALLARENLLSSIFRAAPTGIGVVSNRVLLEVNDRICKMTGWIRKELVGKSARVLYSSDADYEYVGTEKYRQIEEHGTGTVETRWQCKDGRIIDVLLSSTPINPNNLVEGVTFTALDITERKKAEEEKEKLQAQLMQAQKMESVGRLAGGVAHDFNNMLTAILGYSELALALYGPSDPIHAYLTEIQEAGRHSSDLVRQLLAFARKQLVVPKVLDVNTTVVGMLNMLQRLIGEDIDFSWMPGVDLWPVKIDPSQIDQLLANLCVNARDAITGVGKITIETENFTFDEAYCAVHPGITRGEYVMLAVSDNGCGMDGDILDHIYDPFFTTKELGRGTGLGLATVYGIVTQNGGFINVYSEPGRGSTFKIYLPRFAGKATEPTVESRMEMPTISGETVLLVDDEAVILNLGRELLEKMGYKVLTAGSPSDAIRQAETYAGKIDLLITDLVMPEMNGIELSKVLSDVKPGLKYLFTSGYTSNVIVHHGVLDEGLDFLQKPYSMKDLAFKVRDVLEGK